MARWPAKISSLREQAVAALAFFSNQVFDPATGYITGDFDLIGQEIRLIRDRSKTFKYNPLYIFCRLVTRRETSASPAKAIPLKLLPFS
jgi:hypothetical protein